MIEQDQLEDGEQLFLNESQEMAQIGQTIPTRPIRIHLPFG